MKQNERTYPYRIGLCFTLAISLLLLVASLARARQAVKIENVELVPKNESQASVGVRFEQDRSVTESSMTDYDNTRYRPIRLRMGVLDNLELRLGANYSSNSASSPAAPDQAGLEGIELGSKLQWHPNIATTLTAKFNGSNDVHPYGQDNPTFSANIPIKFQLGKGMFHGEAGITLQSGDAFMNGSRIGSWKDYVNYGAGYAYDMNRFAEMSFEIVGHSATVDAPNAEDHLELIFGNGIRIAPDVRFKPSVGFALMDGSPNTSFGFDVEVGMGGRRLPSTDDSLEKKKRFSDRSPVGGTTEPSSSFTQQPKQPRSQPERTSRRRESSMENDTSGPTVDELMQQAYAAAQNGNPQKALKLYKKAYDMDPNNVLVLSNLGSLHYRQENYRKAIEYYRQALQEDPKDTFSLLYLGASHYQLGNRQAARRYFEEVKRLEPNNERVQNWLDKMEN